MNCQKCGEIRTEDGNFVGKYYTCEECKSKNLSDMKEITLEEFNKLAQDMNDGERYMLTGYSWKKGIKERYYVRNN